ncbi:MAG: putative ATPase (AAA+ superfamily) [uncultured bacterium]|nr:MAG: putative ATPase (AAA+ superfamily) [uncultured bacterium]
MQLLFGKTLYPGKTLLILDEIQSSPNALNLLRFLYELCPALHVVAAGSLLDATLSRGGLSLPVGRVEFAYIYPLNFFEYLLAMGETTKLDYLKGLGISDAKKISEPIHNDLNKLFTDYAMVGGMPEVVKIYSETRSLEQVKHIYSSLLTAFTDDVYKYSTLADVRYLSFVIQNAPNFAARLFRYENFAGSNFRSREVSHAFELVEKAQIVHQLKATSSTQLPLIGKSNRPKKLLFLDVGFYNYKADIFSSYLNRGDLNDMYKGCASEQIVGQNLLSTFVDKQPDLYYWAKERTRGQAEVDFCFVSKSHVIGLEVKSGSYGKLASAAVFEKEVSNSKVLRIYSGRFEEERFTSIPFYLLPRIMEFADS